MNCKQLLFTLYYVYIFWVCVYIHCITLHYIMWHYITFHYIALHCIALHCIALHCITLHYLCIHIQIQDKQKLHAISITNMGWICNATQENLLYEHWNSAVRLITYCFWKIKENFKLSSLGFNALDVNSSTHDFWSDSVASLHAVCM